MIQGAQTDFIYVFYLQDIDYDRSQRNIKKVKGIPQYKKYTSNVRLLFYLIAGIIDELTGENKQEHHNKFFEILQSSLTTIGSFKFLILCHKLIYQLQQEFTSRFISNKLIPGDHTDKSRLAIYYYNFLSKLCENFDYYKEVIDFIETENIVKFLQYELLVQIQILFPLASLLQELSQVTFPIYQVVKLLDYLLCRESPLLLQLGTCILKDFCVIYNFLSAAIQELQIQILKVPLKEAKVLYHVYQITIQMTKCMKRLQQLKLYSNFKQPHYFIITIELNKKIELHMLNSIKLSNIEISI
ncbi:unnamed protein product (macronuclear) [Paramecium tetraurelia]|uniref:AP180 N-terminal homology (ANTH) domain-containing protein n=1 Tax=Paramecium tetraurelia TaxID=5888 RepID=A0C2N2_PARTE|nr:uncharacterized protein GSPATT00034527001 [Paramecium tetraurelia]CAK65049.1 unnamed protein product [Paramecium tetraurelia]|eukprot:XP_001432446.1 hypothetical protein (macronuclear) [Paramecium tetraurelia strain d4-2]